MLETGGGRIINVLSIASLHAFPSSAAYVASKFGALGLTRSLAAEYRDKGIRMTALLPGSTDTPLWKRQAWSPEPSDMLKPADVGAAIADIITSPLEASYDEVVLLPPKGIL
jgi:NAD(P)-dependent dehydrogenase (short-subunit alcohol dehydrogenase family)